ncbi:hypothetical protein DFQ28_008199 [Apophysomyces sp. BC1034]|nr:hypothetical protein DFQ30_007711 [Apophysomyces sp. BC1015]KAG0181968.1 hypothetical protein DFQ29_006365 [Apophysomyces sp. BC1021]KAG0192692.1 hypothetical protein DFQ28_008199 [Apophysomyces sp. BC1034]
MRPTDSSQYPTGTTVFAKLKGYPWWPARIEADQNVPAKVLKQRAKTKGPLWTVFFYGSKDYGFFGPDAIRPFDRVNVERDLKAKKFKSKDLELAVRQALDPSSLDEDVDEEEDESGEEEEEVGRSRKAKAKTGRRKQATEAPKRKKAAASNGRRKPKVAVEEEEEEEDTESTPVKSKRRSRKLDEEKTVDENTNDNTRDRKKRVRRLPHKRTGNSVCINGKYCQRKSMSMEKEDDLASASPTVTHKSVDVTQSDTSMAHDEKTKTYDADAYKRTPEFKRTYHTRHRLQKLVYDKKPGEIAQDDYPKIAQVVKDIEELPMTYELLRETKIGKVVKAACTYNYEEDTEYNIKERCQNLMKHWKSLFSDPTRLQEQAKTTAGQDAANAAAQPAAKKEASVEPMQVDETKAAVEEHSVTSIPLTTKEGENTEDTTMLEA